MFLGLALRLALRLAGTVEPGPAWAEPPLAYVHAEPDARSPLVGELRHGDQVLVTGCLPSCEGPDGWAILGDDGAVHACLLRPDPLEGASVPDGGYVYARVAGGPLEIHTRPDAEAPVLRRVVASEVVALSPEASLEGTGWTRTFDDGYVQGARLTPLVASSFSGEPAPATPLAFFLRTTRLRGATGLLGRGIQRFAREPILGIGPQGRVRLDGGTVPRSAVRLAFARPRPAGVGPDDRWVHVDLREQVLTAYAGDRLVFATLVSTGKPGWETSQGLFRVWRKVSHDLMHGEREPYRVEEVPWTLFFHASQALHGTFWHDHFGWPVSHGCVNLSMPDAAWLFEWAPPRLPEGWHAVRPLADRPTLWVQVERAASGSFERSEPAPADPGDVGQSSAQRR